MQSKGKPVPVAVGGECLGLASTREGELNSLIKVVQGQVSRAADTIRFSRQA